MSIHSSLKLKNTLVRARNVFRRIERLNKLEEDGKRTDEESVFGLPKVRTRYKTKKVKKGKEGAEAETKAEEGKAEA